MTDHEKFEMILDKCKLSRRQFAGLINITYKSLTNQLAPSQELPKWAKSVVIVCEKLGDI